MPIKSVALLLHLAFIALLAGCEKQVNRPFYQLSGPTMGTSYNITVVASELESSESRLSYSSLPDQQELEVKVAQLLTQVNQQMSTYIPDSELMRLNAETIGNSKTVSEPLFSVLALAEKIHQDSMGAFDVTIGPLVNLWGFGSDNRAYNPNFKGPSETEISEALSRIGQSKLVLVEGSSEGASTAKRQGDVFIDLSAIAKGYGVDAVAELLEEQGIEHYLVEIGGEIRLKGQSASSRHWRIGIERPAAHGFESAGYEGMGAVQKAVSQAVSLTDIAMATSGDYRNYFEVDGTRYSHTIDPRTGKPVQHKLASVTVLADSSAAADAWATALSVLGEKQGFEVAKSQGIAAFFLIKADNGYRELATESFKPYLD